MKIAVTYDNGQIWQHFGKTEDFKFYNAQDGRIEDASVINTEGQGHGALADFLHEHGAEVIICGGVGAPMIAKLEGFGMKVIPGIEGDADDAVRKYLSGSLEANTDAVHEGCHHHHQ